MSEILRALRAADAGHGSERQRQPGGHLPVRRAGDVLMVSIFIARRSTDKKSRNNRGYV